MIRKPLLVLFASISFMSASSQTIIDSIQIDNVWRNYRLFLPTGFNTSSHLPLVFNLHGYGSNALEQELYTGFDNVADTAHVVMCYPNGLSNAWGIFGNGSLFDVHFIDTLITVLNDQYNINLNRVYATGISNGGFMSNLLGCYLSHRIAAIAPVAGTNVFAVNSDCTPSRMVPILYIHGTTDPVVSYNGSTAFVSANALMMLWTDINGCSTISDTFLLPDISTTDQCRAERITWRDCDSNKQVIHYRITGGGHTWPDAAISIGVTNHDFNASSIIWQFFNQFALNTGIENVVSKSKFLFSPNPFNDFMKIELLHPGKSTVNIYSTDGRLIQTSSHTENSIVLDQRNLIPGIYFLNIVYDNVSETVRIIKIIN